MNPTLPPNLQEQFTRVMSEQPAHADAVVWLQGDRFDRGTKVLELHQGGFAPRIVVTGNNEFVGRPIRPGKDDARLEEIRDWLVARDVRPETILLQDGAHHTGEQAASVIALAMEKGWNAITLIANPYHQLRAFLTFRSHAARMGWDGRILNQPVAQDWDVIPSDHEHTNAELLPDELRKIETYGLL